MKRFDLCRIQTARETVLAVHLQSEFHDHLSTRLVAPIHPEGPDAAIKGITPHVTINGSQYLIRLDQTLTVPVHALSSYAGNLSSYQNDITSALDRLMTGF